MRPLMESMKMTLHSDFVHGHIYICTDNDTQCQNLFATHTIRDILKYSTWMQQLSLVHSEMFASTFWSSYISTKCRKQSLENLRMVVLHILSYGQGQLTENKQMVHVIGCFTMIKCFFLY